MASWVSVCLLLWRPPHAGAVQRGSAWGVHVHSGARQICSADGAMQHCSVLPLCRAGASCLHDFYHKSASHRGLVPGLTSTHARHPVTAGSLTWESAQVVYEDDHLACVVKPQMMQVDTPPHASRSAVNDKVTLLRFMHSSKS